MRRARIYQILLFVLAIASEVAQARVVASTPTTVSVKPAGTVPNELKLLQTHVSKMQPGQWYQIPNTQMNKVLLSSAEANAIDPRIWGTGSHEVIRVWTSAAFDGRKFYFGAGGGHNSYNGNELYAFDFTTLMWKRLTDPSPLTNTTNSGDPVPVFGPQAVHHYDGLVFSPKTNSIFLWGGGTGVCWEYKLGVADPRVAWTKFPCPSEAGAQMGAYYKTAILANQNILIYGGGITNIAEFDPSTKSYSRFGTQWDGTSADYSVADIDLGTQKVYSINFDWVTTPAVSVIDPSAAGALQGAMLPNTSPPAGVRAGACFKFHPPSKQFVVLDNRRETPTFDPRTSAWKTLANSSSPSAPTGSGPNGPYEKCAYIQELDVFAFTNNENEGIWLYRLP